ncbi:MAG: DUF4230 domain-containing protein [Lachnospiraceae bacterium]|nr:DUF4230 domain-containing protein [Lachnospiraceae bacterium]MBQ5359950.1 DUF4230 domain-containing protein [Lachnospiraceae bacterium]
MDFIKRHLNHFYIGVILICAALSLILCVSFVTKKGQTPEPVKTVTEKPEKEKKDRVLISTSSEMIREGLSDLGVLITQEYYFTQVETYTKEKKIFYFIPTTSGFVYSYDGSVMAGVDFTKVRVETDEDRQVITVTLPASEIQFVNIDKNTFQIYSEKDSLWNHMGLEDYNISLIEFENTAREKALASGILGRSDTQAKNLVTEFIGSLPNTSGYRIEFK